MPMYGRGTEMIRIDKINNFLFGGLFLGTLEKFLSDFSYALWKENGSKMFNMTGENGKGLLIQKS